jgi:hypothetical protein
VLDGVNVEPSTKRESVELIKANAGRKALENILVGLLVRDLRREDCCD